MCYNGQVSNYEMIWPIHIDKWICWVDGKHRGKLEFLYYTDVSEDRVYVIQDVSEIKELLAFACIYLPPMMISLESNLTDLK